MLAYVVAILISVSSGESVAAPAMQEMEGTWKYNGPEGGMGLWLRRGGRCQVAGSIESGLNYLSQCTYEMHGPRVDIQLAALKDGTRPEPLRFVWVAGGEMMRLEGEARRPLRRVWEVAAKYPEAIDLDESGAMALLESQDPEGHRKVLEMVDIVRTHGCQGAFLGLIKSLVQTEAVACGTMDNPPKSWFFFWLGDKRYRLTVYPKPD
jgi:hypothetical protein